jgi:hypothetical protein
VDSLATNIITACSCSGIAIILPIIFYDLKCVPGPVPGAIIVFELHDDDDQYMNQLLVNSLKVKVLEFFRFTIPNQHLLFPVNITFILFNVQSTAHRDLHYSEREDGDSSPSVSDVVDSSLSKASRLPSNAVEAAIKARSLSPQGMNSFFLGQLLESSSSRAIRFLLIYRAQPSRVFKIAWSESVRWPRCSRRVAF